ncbi:sigma-70 family RNA polymerase sigma factor [Candidatus Dojkabacteria bacterium]|nr:sigma-70 family RNA polymerase sigma factor [Candidatus Dojkabacteria bacterium]
MLLSVIKLHVNEKQLIKKAKKGKKEALEKLYSQNFTSLFKYVKYKVDSDEITEDICAESFTRAFETIERFRGKSSFKTYVYAIARNLIIKHYQTKSKKYSLTEREYLLKDYDQNDQNQTNKKSDAEKEVAELLSNLNEKERKVIEYRYLFSMSVKDTADALNLSESNVKVITHRALKKCKKIVFEKT